jgi:predicted peroxiredoxin
MSIKLTVESAYVEAIGVNYIEVTLDGVSLEDVLEHIDPKEAVECYGASTFLELIGEEEARAHFGIEVAA